MASTLRGSADELERQEAQQKSGLTSLVSIRLLEGERKQACARTKVDLLNLATGEVIPAPCKAYICDVCGPRKLRMVELALAWACPERFVTFTLAPADRQQRRKQMGDLATRVRKVGFDWQAAWVTEVNPAGTGHHIHALQKGKYIPQAVLQEMWGGRIVHIAALKNNAAIASQYVIKQAHAEVQAAGYILKAPAAGTRNRPVNVSRGYFGGKTMDGARAEVKDIMYGTKEEKGTWVRIPRS